MEPRPSIRSIPQQLGPHPQQPCVDSGVVDIKAGGSVNFIIGGFHHILIYDDGTKPSDINVAALIPTTVQPGPPLINDPVKRIYRGLDPSVMPLLPGSTPPRRCRTALKRCAFRTAESF